jgi:hypothetical protein
MLLGTSAGIEVVRGIPSAQHLADHNHVVQLRPNESRAFINRGLARYTKEDYGRANFRLQRSAQA